MPGFEWLIFKEGETKGNPKKIQEFTHNFCLISRKNNARHLLAGKCQDDFKRGCVNVTAATVQKMRVGKIFGTFAQNVHSQPILKF